MTKLWKALCIAVVAAGMAAPTQVQAGPIEDFLCQTFNIACPAPGECNCTDEIAALEDALQGQIDSLAGQLSTTNNNLAALTDQVNGCCGDVEHLQELVDAIVDDIYGSECELLLELTDCDGNCVDLDSDEANCGECGFACEPGEECNWGDCEVIPCPAPAGDPNFECNEAFRDEEGICHYIPVNNTLACNDNNACTDSESETCNNGICLSNGDTPCGTGETCALEGDSFVCVPD